MIDLHCHSKLSDGALPVPELIRRAADEGITHLAITDHDTMEGLEEALLTGKREGITVIPGVEISAFDVRRDKQVHILGLFIEPGHPAIKKLCDPILEERTRAAYEMTRKIADAGYDITWREVLHYAKGSTAVYKQHIMHALIDRGYADRIYGPLYNKLFSCGNNGKIGLAYTPVQYADVFEAIRAVKDAGGIPVLAHPKLFDNFDAIPDLAAAGLEGIETVHPVHGPSDEKLAGEYAEKYDLVETGGSDFHGCYGNYPLGRDIGYERYDQLLEHYKTKIQFVV